MATGLSETHGELTGENKDISELPSRPGLSKQASAESSRIALGQLLTDLISNNLKPPKSLKYFDQIDNMERFL